MNYTDINNIPGLLVLIDFEKAFDSLAWSFIYKVLDLFNFGQVIKTWIKIFYFNISSSVIQNGFVSNFSVKRDCRQGDPISPYIFILCAEILSVLIKKCKDIKGISINGREFKISQFADDTSLILNGSQESLFNALKILDKFANISGLNINSTKTIVILIGSKKYSAQVYHHVKWKLNWGETEFTLLGIDFHVNLNEMITINFNKAITKIVNLLKQWEKRNLTPIGRITVLKTIIIPKQPSFYIITRSRSTCDFYAEDQIL